MNEDEDERHRREEKERRAQRKVNRAISIFEAYLPPLESTVALPIRD
jgi:hypothetical protein